MLRLMVDSYILSLTILQFRICPWKCQTTGQITGRALRFEGYDWEL
jgi:hypothetical protein